MANNIIGQVAGGIKTVLDNVESVQDVKQRLGATEGYTAAVNGNPADNDQVLEDGDMVTFSKAVKGGLL